MQRPTVLSSVVVLLLAACSANAGRSSSTLEPVAEPATTIEAIPSTNSTAQSTTTTESEGPIVLSTGRALILESGTEYSNNEFVVPFSFRVGTEGWRWYGAGEDWAYLGWVSDGAFAAALAIVDFRGSQSPEEVVDAIASIDGVEVVDGHVTVEILGTDAITLDVEGTPERAQSDDRRCTREATMGRFFFDEPGYALVIGSRPFEYGIAACKTSRLWVIAVGGRSITLIGGAADPGRFDELIPEVQRLLNSLTFGPP